MPPELTKSLREDAPARHVDLYSEQYEVRESAKRNLFTGKTYNSLENISQFFAERGIAAPRPPKPLVAAPTPAPPPRPAPRAPGAGFRSGTTIQHPKYGRGTILRREGDGEDAKLTVSFPGHGLKKIIEKYAGIRIDE